MDPYGAGPARKWLERAKQRLAAWALLAGDPERAQRGRQSNGGERMTSGSHATATRHAVLVRGRDAGDPDPSVSDLVVMCSTVGRWAYRLRKER